VNIDIDHFFDRKQLEKNSILQWATSLRASTHKAF